MSIKISIKKNQKDKVIKNYVLFCSEEYKIYGLNNLKLNNRKKELSQSILSHKSKDKKIISFNINSDQRLSRFQFKRNCPIFSASQSSRHFYSNQMQ